MLGLPLGLIPQQQFPHRGMMDVGRDAQITLDHIALVVHRQLTADDDGSLRIRQDVAHLAVIAVAAENDVVAIASEPNGDDVRLAVCADGSKTSHARLAEELANAAIQDDCFLRAHGTPCLVHELGTLLEACLERSVWKTTRGIAQYG